MNDPQQELFANYARHYKKMGAYRDRLPDDLERLKRDRLPAWIDTIPRNARVLDVGCAEGHWLEALRRVGFSQLTGVELSAQLLESARARLGDHAQLIQADVRDWIKRAPAASYDLIFFHDVLEHLPREETISILREFHRLLAPAGKLRIRVPNLACLVGPFHQAIDFTHITPFTEFSLLQVLEAAGFSASCVTFESQAPRLFWSWRRPHRALLRLLNRLRWHLNRVVHKAVYLLNDYDMPRCYDIALVALAHK